MKINQQAWVLACSLMGLLALIAGCSSNAPSLDKASTLAAPQAIVESKWKPMLDGSIVSYDLQKFSKDPNELALNNGESIKAGDWIEYQKPYTESFQMWKRDTIIEGFSRCNTEFDKEGRVINFDSKLSLLGASYIALSGTLHDRSSTVKASIRYQGKRWVNANSFVVITDGTRSKEYTPIFDKDYFDGVAWETASLDLGKKEYRSMVEKIIDSKSATIRFQGGQSYADIQVTDKMKSDMLYILSMADAVRGR